MILYKVLNIIVDAYRVVSKNRTVRSQNKNFPSAISTALSLKSAPPYPPPLQVFTMNFKQNRKKRIDKHETINHSILLRFSWRPLSVCGKKTRKNEVGLID